MERRRRAETKGCASMTATAVITQREGRPPSASAAEASPESSPDAGQMDAEQSVTQEPAAGDELATMEHALSEALHRSSGTLALVGVTVLAGATLFGIGWMWRDLKPVGRRILYTLEDIRIPVALPVALGEIGWRVFADSRSDMRQLEAAPAPKGPEK